MKYIFLDIDGVLWTVGWSIYCNRSDERKCYEQWDMIQTSNLQWVLDQAAKNGVEVKIVISSTWRLGRTIEELKEIAQKSGLDPNSVIGKTPSIWFKKPRKHWYRKCWGPWYNRILWHRTERHEAERGEEIQHWMDEHGVKAEDIVILDDDSDMAHLKHRWVKTDSQEGMGFGGALKVAKMLGIRDN